MKVIMVMFDTLCRRMLPPYGCDWVKAPNFNRMAENSVVFDNSYGGSMPCIPARRELHSGRYNFLHRSWGPLEPFDDSMPEILKENGIWSHLISDHYHYWEDGGSSFHNRYSSWEISRGQEGEFFKCDLGEVNIPEHIGGQTGAWGRQDWLNRTYMKEQKDHPQANTFAMGEEFIRTNCRHDNWFLQIETFDPHEPYFSYEQYKDLYPHEYDGPFFDWPEYSRVKETPEQVEHLRYQYAALLSMCDHHLGRILALMDEFEMWKDTMLIVNTDHGVMLGEHGWWGKQIQPFYNEIIHIPLFIWDPRCGKRNERRSSLVQMIDIPATILEFFGIETPKDTMGKSLKDTIADDRPVREVGLFGVFGGHVNCTDGRYVYMRGAANKNNEPLYHYTLMPMHMRRLFTPEELRTAELRKPFAFTKGCSTLKVKAGVWDERNPFALSGYVNPADLNRTMLFDLKNDPEQNKPIDDKKTEQYLVDHMLRLMDESDAPEEQYQRVGLTRR